MIKEIVILVLLAIYEKLLYCMLRFDSVTVVRLSVTVADPGFPKGAATPRGGGGEEVEVGF